MTSSRFFQYELFYDSKHIPAFAQAQPTITHPYRNKLDNMTVFKLLQFLCRCMILVCFSGSILKKKNKNKKLIPVPAFAAGQMMSEHSLHEITVSIQLVMV